MPAAPTPRSGNAKTNNSASSVTSFAVNTPTGTLDGDLMIAAVNCPNANAVTGTGWTVLTVVNLTGNNRQLTVLYKYASGEGTTQSFAIASTGASYSMAILSIQNAGALDTDGYTTAGDAVGGANFNCPSINTPRDSCLVVYCISAASTSSQTLTFPGGAIQQEADSGLSVAAAAIGTNDAATSAATGTAQWHSSLSPRWNGLTIAVQPIQIGAPLLTSM